MALSETDIIQRFFSVNSGRDDVVLGIGDDAALTRVPANCDLVSATDTIGEGVHFPAGLAAADIGYRALAVNLSDHAAMGAQPAWALLSLSLPAAEETWLAEFARGFFEAARLFDVALIGGDLVRGPLAATVTLLGYVPSGAAITRAGARPGDRLYVTGTPGAAARGLAALSRDDRGDAPEQRAFLRPQPRVTQGQALRLIASAAIDVSDGLVTDAGHIARCSGVQVRIDALALCAITGADGLDAALAGGDDYELCFSVPAAREQALSAVIAGWSCPATCIGAIDAGEGVSVSGYSGRQVAGFDHFR